MEKKSGKSPKIGNGGSKNEKRTQNTPKNKKINSLKIVGKNRKNKTKIGGGGEKLGGKMGENGKIWEKT